MARIAVNWEEPSVGSAYEGFDAANMMTGLPDEYAESGKPVIIYLESALEDDMVRTALITSTMERDEKVAIGMKMFNIVRMNGLKIGKDHPYAKILGGRKLPRMVVISPEGKKVGSVEGSISPSKLFSLMNRAASKVYKTPIGTFVKEYQKVLTEIDKVEAAKAILATRRATSADAPRSRTRRFDQDEEKLVKLEQEIMNQEKELLAFKVRAGKP